MQITRAKSTHGAPQQQQVPDAHLELFRSRDANPVARALIMYVSAHDVVVHYASLGHQVGDRREGEHEREHHLCPSGHGPSEWDGSGGGGGG